MPHSTRPLHIAVVGGGIGGLALAVGLAKAQRDQATPTFTFTVYEAAASFQEIGAGVGVGPNAYRTLTALGLGKEFGELAAKHQEQERHALDGVYFSWRQVLPHNVDASAGEDEICQTLREPGHLHATVHRAKFLNIMIAAVPPEVARFHKRLLSYSILNDGQVSLEFLDGTSALADVLVACDGIKSAVRPILLKGLLHDELLKPCFTGTVCYRALLPMAEMAPKLGAKAWYSTMYLGKNKHILTFPIDSGQTLNVVIFVSDRSIPNPTLPEGEAWIKDVSVEEMMAGFEGWSEDCLTILKAVKNVKQPQQWRLHELHDLPTHAIGPVCLLGDSAAATLPHQGQGAAMAIESGYLLSTLLSHRLLTPETAPLALGAFAAQRRSRVTAIKNTSRALGEILEFSDSVILGDPGKLAQDLQGRYKWIWGWEPEEEAQKAKEVLEAELRRSA
ncbi:hypothetical protein JCM21900_005209 [Sporobolomyces salmonicolor]